MISGLDALRLRYKYGKEQRMYIFMENVLAHRH